MKIGIFWVHKETVLGIAENSSQGFKGYGGLIDSNFDHVHVWENLELRKQFPEKKIWIMSKSLVGEFYF